MRFTILAVNVCPSCKCKHGTDGRSKHLSIYLSSYELLHYSCDKRRAYKLWQQQQQQQLWQTEGRIDRQTQTHWQTKTHYSDSKPSATLHYSDWLQWLVPKLYHSSAARNKCFNNTSARGSVSAPSRIIFALAWEGRLSAAVFAEFFICFKISGWSECFCFRVSRYSSRERLENFQWSREASPTRKRRLVASHRRVVVTCDSAVSAVTVRVTSHCQSII